MRIYIAGAHSVGKSTLARYIAKTYKLHFISEVARAVLAEKELNIETLRIDLDVADDYQKTIFYRQIDEEKKYSSFVSDRTFDNLAYAAAHSRILSQIIKSKEFEEYIESLKKDDVIIFFVRPTKLTMKNDGVRETVVWDEIIRIDAMIKLLFEMFDIKYVNVSVDSMQERIKLTETILQLKNSPSSQMS